MKANSLHHHTATKALGLRRGTKRFALLTACCCMLIAATSCMDDFLSTESPSEPTSESVYQSTTLTEAALMGVYSAMTDSYVYGQKLCVNWQASSDVEVGGNYFNTDNYNKTNSDTGAGNFWDDPYNQTTKWQKLYAFVEGATSVEEGIRGSELLDENSTDRETMLGYLGEALVLKALGYFELVRYWGDVPFKEDPSNSDLSNVYQPKADRDTVYSHIIANLEEAIDYLPWMGDGDYNVERVTKGFAKGLLARVALFAGGWSVRDGNTFPNLDLEHNTEIAETGGYFVGRPKNWEDYYEIALKQTAELIGSSDNPHALDPDFEDIWETVNGLGYNSYGENLFEVAFGESNTGDVGATMGYILSSGVLNASTSLGGSGYVGTTAYYFYSFDPEDTRRDVTCCFQQYTQVDAVNKEQIKCTPLEVGCGKWRWYWMTDNYINTLFPDATSRISTGINWILMRYSDVLLMFAEAANQVNGSPDVYNSTAGMTARQALEAVRERAFGSGSAAITDYNVDFLTAIQNERAWEFGCESLRRQDLTRWGLLYENIEKMKENLCLMYDYQDFTCFDREYSATDMPRRLYYKYDSAGEYVDLSSVNFYQDKGMTTPSGYSYVNWIPMQVTVDGYGEVNDEINSSYADKMADILTNASGLMVSYDYSDLFGRLRWGTEAQSELAKFTIGNSTCNYRHVYAIYYEDIAESQGYLVNSFGF